MSKNINDKVNNLLKKSKKLDEVEENLRKSLNKNIKEDPLKHEIYHDPNPPQWPHNGIPFNRWYRRLHAFIWALKTQHQWYNHPLFGRSKYIHVKIDTRNGNFLVFCEGDTEGSLQTISPDDLKLVYKPVSMILKDNFKEFAKDEMKDE